MKILLVGAHGTVGRGVAAELGARHDVITAGRRGATVALDLADAGSIRRALEPLGPLDAIVSAAGQVSDGRPCCSLRRSSGPSASPTS